MTSYLIGLALGGYIVLIVSMFIWWEKVVARRLLRWHARRTERRLVATGHWSPEEAHEIVATWQDEAQRDYLGES